MKRNLTFLMFATLTFLLGTAMTRAIFRWDVQFRSSGVGSAGMCEEGFGGFSSFESYDGEKLMFSRIRFPSRTTAHECFEATLRKGEFRVLSREELFDKAGANIVGERVIGKNDVDGPNSGFVFSLDEDSIVEIISTSQRHALIFEKRVRKY